MNDAKKYTPGQILSIRWYAGIQHDGIYAGDDKVIAASKRTGKVCEQTVLEFSAGRKIRSKGYPSESPPHIVVALARAKIGKKYNLIGYNCQHFASECHGQKHSRQLRSVLLSTAGFTALAILSRGRIFRA